MNETEQLLEQVAAHARASRAAHDGPLPGVLGPGDLDRAEAILGFPLPPLLAGLHTRVADGGIGPGYGLLPLLDGPSAAVTAYRDMRRSGWRWPEGVLPVLDWGCGMYACVDCRSPDAQVLLFEPNLGDPEVAWFVDAPSLAQWLRGWLDGTAWYCEDGDAGEAEDLDPLPWERIRTRA
ncbi:SMI1/KNR4 family protein [Streptomyces sp. NPDC101132]|uniref:SMI1/KNR4 family protein n=1 Tax=Streptomyces sp. NPDC101132 TaxID=3366110 RepID=UPI00382A6BCB